MWTNTVGLINGHHKYLTAETFGFKINANGTAMKKKQQWSIELFPIPDQSEEVSGFEYVAIKSHLGCYLAVDAYGNVTCEQKERNDNCRFIITICEMSYGGNGSEVNIYWAFKNVIRNYYLGSSSDGMINCKAKVPQSRAELWHVHLIPSRGSSFFSLKSLGRKRFARAIFKDENGSEQIKVDATESWGTETLFQLKYFENGKYALITSKGNYLKSEGNCININSNKNVLILNKLNASGNGVTNQDQKSNLPPKDCLFTIEFHSGSIAFRDMNGQYLAGTGHASILKTRSSSVSKDELFEFNPAPLQLALRATFNNKWVSTKQSSDLTANQNEITSNNETFLFNYHKDTKSWTIRSKEGLFWALSATSISANCKDEKTAAHFQFKWHEDGCFSLVASSINNFADSEKLKTVCNRKSGQLFASSISNNQEPVKFQFKIENRFHINLRASVNSGFLGLKNADDSKIEVNKITPDSIIIEYGLNETINDEMVRLKKAGIVTESAITTNENCNSFNYCYFKMAVNDKYLTVVDNSIINCDATTQSCAQQWVIEIASSSTMLIKTYETSSYLILNNQGILTLSNCNPEQATLWEF